jgi:hypothetical protein
LGCERAAGIYRFHCGQSACRGGDYRHRRHSENTLDAGRDGETGRRARDLYYYNETAPVYLLTVYAKSKKENLSPQEKSAFRKVVEAIKTQIRERQKAKRS